MPILNQISGSAGRWGVWTTQSWMPASRVPAADGPFGAAECLGEHKRAVSAVKFSRDGKLLASAGKPCPASVVMGSHEPGYSSPLCSCAAEDASIRLWDVATARPLSTLTGHAQGVSDVAWTRDPRFLASGSDDKTIRIWDVETVSIYLVWPPRSPFERAVRCPAVERCMRCLHARLAHCLLHQCCGSKWC
jgi:WD40 repeat protein